MRTYTATKKGPGRVYKAGTKKAGFWLSRGIPVPRGITTTISTRQRKGDRK